VRGPEDTLTTAAGDYFHAGITICIGTGGPQACRWTAGRPRVFSQFKVFTRARFGGIVRSFTIATRAGHGLIRIGHHAEDNNADFYMDPVSVQLLAPSSTPARFHTIVSPLAAALTRQENTAACTGG
jgi:hypothetical protein